MTVPRLICAPLKNRTRCRVNRGIQLEDRGWRACTRADLQAQRTRKAQLLGGPLERNVDLLVVIEPIAISYPINRFLRLNIEDHLASGGFGPGIPHQQTLQPSA